MSPYIAAVFHVSIHSCSLLFFNILRMYFLFNFLCWFIGKHLLGAIQLISCQNKEVSVQAESAGLTLHVPVGAAHGDSPLSCWKPWYAVTYHLEVPLPP